VAGSYEHGDEPSGSGATDVVSTHNTKFSVQSGQILKFSFKDTLFFLILKLACDSGAV
jgi:hypothetical protein